MRKTNSNGQDSRDEAEAADRFYRPVIGGEELCVCGHARDWHMFGDACAAHGCHKCKRFVPAEAAA